ncbi:Fat storage inducing transmembrane protein [Carabus blaptoides fortunei]
MSSKRRPSTQTTGHCRMNFRHGTGESSKWEVRGTKPTSTPTSVKEIMTIMVLHVCKKSIFFDTNLKVGIYMGALFLLSLIADFTPMPKTYLSRSDNLFNYYFVKFAWGWNLLLLTPFMLMSTYVYCCGEKDKIAKMHLPRIVIATCCWFFWTKLFNIIEANYGRCNVRADAYNTKQECLKAGFFWHGFDLSGHSFILIYGSLMLIEETRSIVNWESIREFIRIEDHYRATKDTSVTNNPLRFLTTAQFQRLKISYEKFTPYIRSLFIAITLLQILWDIMLICTMLYYHIMIEKFLGGVIAIFTWFATYRFWYRIPKLFPAMPADGLFKYIKDKPSLLQTTPASKKRTGSVVNGKDIPRFMGMPLYGLRPETNQTNGPETTNDDSSTR